ncbi:MAG TPA: hypothetical protein VJT49_15560 [Amycolatopsis sp.]|uniref:hypothetical protein n=1 Tax=Amycolatopsis sp. TaxID=37632 RepID=UPI002B496C30|nr:hypothetical protein [Amycolatopsis sp.]HKS46495.1 hypothetical protein [Amycolatopsis sp.]
MNDQELTALQHVADNEVLFHRGMWSGPAGYRWRGPDGIEAGSVPQWETEVLDLLIFRGMIRTERRLGPLDRELAVTPTGEAALGRLAAAA